MCRYNLIYFVNFILFLTYFSYPKAYPYLKYISPNGIIAPLGWTLISWLKDTIPNVFPNASPKSKDPASSGSTFHPFHSVLPVYCLQLYNSHYGSSEDIKYPQTRIWHVILDICHNVVFTMSSLLTLAFTLAIWTQMSFVSSASFWTIYGSVLFVFFGLHIFIVRMLIRIASQLDSIFSDMYKVTEGFLNGDFSKMMDNGHGIAAFISFSVLFHYNIQFVKKAVSLIYDQDDSGCVILEHDFYHSIVITGLNVLVFTLWENRCFTTYPGMPYSHIMYDLAHIIGGILFILFGNTTSSKSSLSTEDSMPTSPRGFSYRVKHIILNLVIWSLFHIS